MVEVMRVIVVVDLQVQEGFILMDQIVVVTLVMEQLLLTVVMLELM